MARVRASFNVFTYFTYLFTTNKWLITSCVPTKYVMTHSESTRLTIQLTGFGLMMPAHSLKRFNMKSIIS